MNQASYWCVARPTVVQDHSTIHAFTKLQAAKDYMHLMGCPREWFIGSISYEDLTVMFGTAHIEYHV